MLSIKKRARNWSGSAFPGRERPSKSSVCEAAMDGRRCSLQPSVLLGTEGKGGQRSQQLPAELTQLLLLFPPPNTEVFLLVCVHSVFNTARSSRERGAVGSQASAAGAVL